MKNEKQKFIIGVKIDNKPLFFEFKTKKKQQDTFEFLKLTYPNIEIIKTIN